jgi:hypothetical protein
MLENLNTVEQDSADTQAHCVFMEEASRRVKLPKGEKLVNDSMVR